jgi:putative ABC transport system permease protein
MISTAALPATGLDQPGTVSVTVAACVWTAGHSAAAVMAAADKAFPEAGWRARDTSQAAPSVQSFIERTGLFLGPWSA